MKRKVGVLIGGKSSEHNISLLSGKNVVNAMSKDLYEVVLIFIDKEGQWYYGGNTVSLDHEDDANSVIYSGDRTPVTFSQNADDHGLYHRDSGVLVQKVDILYPVLHGNYGEDGSIQGLARLANIPIVGCGILGAAVGMDKDITKKILQAEGISVAPSLTVRGGIGKQYTYAEAADILGPDLFIKPVTMGSSVGVSYVKDAEAYDKALALAFSMDNKVLIESKIIGREIECAVKGNYIPQASAIGEVIPQNEWYSYESKYIDADGAIIAIPAQISDSASDKAKEVAKAAYAALECRGLTRVDMFLTEDEDIYVNEVNTLPGFTKISMYPKLWEVSGTSYALLITELIDFAIERHSVEHVK